MPSKSLKHLDAFERLTALMTDLRSGERLPSERELMRQWGVGRTPLNKAVGQLIAIGRLRREGYRLFVAARPPEPVEVHVLHSRLPVDAPDAATHEIVAAATTVATAGGARVVPVLDTVGLSQRERLRRLLDRGDVRAILLWPRIYTEYRPLLDRAVEAGVKLVVLDLDQGPFDFVGIDNEAGTRLAVKHLYHLGHRQLVFASDTPYRIPSLRRRLDGYRSGCLALGMESSALRVIEVEYGNFHSAADVFQQVRRDYPQATAIVFANDFTAIPAVEAATAAGVRIGRDLSVTGFDDTYESTTCDPPLTTVAQDFPELGATAMSLLLRRLANQGPPTRIALRLEPRLIIRQSTGPAPT